MYVIPDSHLAGAYQGDILKDFPFFDLSSPKPIVESEDGLTYTASADGKTVSQLAAVGIDRRNVMLLSQSCDAENRKYLIFCPIYTIEEYIQSDQPNSDKLRSLRKGELYYWFYLPEETGIILESFVDFQQFFYVPKETFQRHENTAKILQLNDLGRHRLAWAISNYFGRPL